MASLYPKQRSPFWWIRYRHPLTGKPRDESTKLRRDDREQTREARKRCAQYTADELGSPRAIRGEDWAWVDSFLVLHYPNALTLLRARQAWFALNGYMRAKRIASPRLLTREHCADYIAWRTSGRHLAELGLRDAKHNTARLELQFLSAIMREAVLRKRADANPCLQLGVKRAAGKIKPEFTQEQIQTIESRLRAERGKNPHNEAMQTAWDIAMLHVCRLRETCVPLADVDLEQHTITFHTKGGGEQTKLLHPELVPLFRRLKREGKRFAYEMPNNWSKIWKYFFKRCGYPDLSFHCIRVTGVNVLRRKGVDQRTARDYVGHSSVIVNRGYERWKPSDHAPAVNALSRTTRSSLSARSRKGSRGK